MSITDKRLTDIRARLAAATEGPWSVDGPAQCGPGDTLTVYPVEDGGTIAYVRPSWDDAEFIAHAREDIPALLAEVERLREELAKARAVTEDKVERAADAMIAASPDRYLITEHEREWYVRDARVALQTALGGGDDA